MSSARIQEALLIPRPVSRCKLGWNETISEWIGSWITVSRRVYTNNAYESQEHSIQGGRSHPAGTTEHTFKTYSFEAEHEHITSPQESLEIS